MGAFHVLTSKDLLGTIVVVDERNDGTVIVLECEEAENGGGVSVPSDPDDDTVYPRPRSEAAAIERSAEVAGTFEVVLNTSEMPAGRLTFEMERFIERASQAQDESPIQLNEDSAEEWGFKGGQATLGGPGSGSPLSRYS